ncbi:putative quinol monooxygenase [Streptomyces sp. YGL11-2]|uniref:putative quinol monooxygenase n=1 Tax=Streptomyces sp. YGL11-2 TaxID=3414028 RepID=UPI003CF132FE
MQVMVRYTVRQERVDESVALLHAVYADLARARPRGLRYETYRLDGSGRFLALITSDGDPVAAPHHQLASFQRYRAALSEVCSEPPVVTYVDEVGSYRSLETSA